MFFFVCFAFFFFNLHITVCKTRFCVQKDKLKGNDLAIPELIGQELGGLTGIWFNLLHSKRYKANRHSQPPYSIKNVIKKDFKSI